MEEKHLDELLEDQKKTLERMEEENRRLFEAIGVGAAELINATSAPGGAT